MTVGHLSIAGIAKLTWFEKENLLFLSVASYVPDLIDKPLNMLFELPGRGLSHSLIFFSAVIAITWFLRTWLNFSSRTLVAGIWMWGIHLVADFQEPQVLFWPFGGHWGPGSAFDIVQRLWKLHVDKLHFAQLWLELACVMVFFALLFLKQFMSSRPQQRVLRASGLPSSDHDL